jgi:hypothetical protein
VAVLADTDSRWKWAVQLARRLHPVLPVIGYQLGLSNLPSRRQLVVAGIDPARVRTVEPADLTEALAADEPDVLILALPGGGAHAMLHLLAAARLPRRPLVVTGYVGVVYEKLVEGLLLRAGSDLVAANSPADHERFHRVYSAVGIDTDCLVLSRLSFLADRGARARGRYTVTFAAQPGVPGTRSHRRYVVERLAEHARAHPERDVLLKLRTMPGEVATHADRYPYPDLFRELGPGRPANLRLAGGDMGDVLARTDLLVTVSSTAAVEAIHRGIPTAVLTDFGVRESLGNSHFLSSGCLASFADLDAGAEPVADAHWARRNGLGNGIDELPSRVAELLTAGDLPPLRPFYTRANAPALLPGMLARYGVGTDGRPLASVRNGTGLLRSAVRRSARSMYRHGADVVAPALRRLAAL